MIGHQSAAIYAGISLATIVQTDGQRIRTPEASLQDFSFRVSGDKRWKQISRCFFITFHRCLFLIFRIHRFSGAGGLITPGPTYPLPLEANALKRAHELPLLPPPLTSRHLGSALTSFWLSALAGEGRDVRNHPEIPPNIPEHYSVSTTAAGSDHRH